VIPGIAVEIDREAAVVRSDRPLLTVSSAVLGGGLGQARAVVNLHVGKNDPCVDAAGMLARFAARRAVPSPFVGLLTSAWTERAAVAEGEDVEYPCVAVATVGLGNPVTAGQDPVAVWAPSTINTIIVVDADPEPAALVNAVITVTEVKVLALARAGIRAPGGGPASGTSTDAVVICATGRGRRARFGGPVSELGWTIARAVRNAFDMGIAAWQEHNLRS
jgi:adenosylcobinamide hydrolase